LWKKKKLGTMNYHQKETLEKEGKSYKTPPTTLKTENVKSTKKKKKEQRPPGLKREPKKREGVTFPEPETMQEKR